MRRSWLFLGMMGWILHAHPSRSSSVFLDAAGKKAFMNGMLRGSSSSCSHRDCFLPNESAAPAVWDAGDPEQSWRRRGRGGTAAVENLYKPRRDIVETFSSAVGMFLVLYALFSIPFVVEID